MDYPFKAANLQGSITKNVIIEKMLHIVSSSTTKSVTKNTYKKIIV